MSKKEKKVSNILENEVIEPHKLPEVMSLDFARYAKAVLTDRAIPDVRDGMKPVQRRIIFGMYKEGNTFDKPTRKSATTVGYVMGHFHPHGDASIYDALIRLSQDWKMEVPLVVVQGNNGSIDDDPAAAARYTEAKLAKISELLVEDLDKNTVNMQLNFSDEEYEPTVLPARFPNLLVNGAQGIAVGAVTNIPTHNLGEVIDATIYAIEHKTTTVADLRKFILGPDFPTGGIIDQAEELTKLYETGQASFFVHCKTEIDSKNNQIIITEIPYGTIKAQFVAALDKFKDSAHVDNITEVRDESSDDVRIVIDIKQGQSPEPILEFLRSKGVLKSTFSANMLALDKGHPRTMNLLDIIRAYIDHQVDVLTRKSNFQLARDKEKLEVTNGLIKAVDIVDELIKVIKASSGKQDAKNNIKERFGFSEIQAEAIVMLNLYRISSLDYKEYIQTKDELEKHIVELNRLLTDREYLNKHIVSSLKEIKKNYPFPRKTQILETKMQAQKVDATELFAKEDVYVVVTADGYIKRSSLKSHDQSVSDDIEKSLPKLKTGDIIKLSLKCSTHDGIIVFFSSGTYVYIPVYMIPDLKWKEEGKHINVLIKNLASEDKVVAAYAINDFSKKIYFASASKKGKIKRSLLKDFEQTRLTPRQLRYMALSKGDEVVGITITTGNSDLIVMQVNGYVSRYNENEVPVVGLAAAGVKSINLGKDNPEISSLIALDSSERAKLLIVSDKGGVRAVMSMNIDTTPRLSSKQALVKVFKSTPLNIVELIKFSSRLKESTYSICVTEKRNIIIDLRTLETSLPGAGLKPGFDLEKGELIKGVHVESEIINSSTKEEVPPIIETVEVNDQEGEKQMSLFDLFDEEGE